MTKFGIFVPLLLAFLVPFTIAQLNASSDANNQRGLPMNWIEKKIKEKIESFREVLRNGDPALGIPILDPFVREKEVISTNSSLVEASIEAKDLTVNGLSSYAVDDVRFSLANMSATVKLSWAGIKAKGNYKLDGDFKIPYGIGKAPLYGNGDARALIYQFWVESRIKVSVDDDDIISVSDLLLSWDIVNPQVRIDGLFGGQEMGDTINQLVEDLIPKLDAAYHEQVQKTLQEKLIKLINDWLSGAKDGDDDSYVSLLKSYRYQ